MLSGTVSICQPLTSTTIAAGLNLLLQPVGTGRQVTTRLVIIRVRTGVCPAGAAYRNCLVSGLGYDWSL